MKAPLVHILIATFNGENFLAEQLNSIICQSYTNWRITLRDDGSNDQTSNIINHYTAMDQRIAVIDIGGEPTGLAWRNFGKLLAYAKTVPGKYIAFADQDDVWFSNKLERQVNILEKCLTPNAPILLHSDLEVVDEKLNLINRSFFAYSNINHVYEKPIERLLTQNFVTGCTCIFNRFLLEKAAPLPDMLVMHDWWLALIASSTGLIKFDEKTTVKYRQHGTNSVGASEHSNILNPFRKKLYQELISSRKDFQLVISQLKSLLEYLRDDIHANKDSLDEIRMFIYFCEAGGIEKFKLYSKIRLDRSSVFYKLALLFNIFFYKKR